MRVNEYRRGSLVLACALGVFAAGACGDTNSAGDEAAMEEAPIETPEDAPSAATESSPEAMPGEESGALTVGDLDAYERGLQAEMEAVQQAIEQREQATTSEDSLNAMFAATEMQTVEAGAGAAGMSVDRYREVSSELSSVLGAMSAPDLMALTVDTTLVPADQRASMRDQMQQLEAREEEALAALDPAVAEALQQRATQLDSLRLTLAGTRLQAAQ